MRIGIICPYSLTLPGGVQMQVLALAQSLRNKGFSTQVLGPCDGPPPDAGVTPLGNSLPTLYNGSTAPIAPDISCQLRTIRAIRDESFDVIHLHEPLVPGPTVTALLTQPAPLIGTFHAAGRSWAYNVMPKVAGFLASRLAYRTAVSADAKNMAHKAFGGQYDLLYNGVDLSLYNSTAPQASRSSWPTVLFIGRNDPRKGLDVLIEAFHQLPQNTQLWIAGSGTATSNARSHARSSDKIDQTRIKWLGVVDDTEKIARLKGADILCAPSLRGESFGIVLLEAMASSTAVVASDIPGYRNVAKHNHNALLVPPGNPTALAEALNTLIRNRSEAVRLAEAGKNRACEFSMDTLAGHYLKRYHQIAAI